MSFTYTTRKYSGFTLIEMMVALSLFTIVVTIAVGALLSLIGSSKGVQNEQSVMATLTFVLDSMTREIRTGTEYYCSNSNFNNQESINNGKDCAVSEKGGVSFTESGSSLSASSKRIAYYYDSGSKSIMRQIGDNSSSNPPESIVSNGITITNAEFSVTGTARLDPSGDTVQPTVTIILEAQDEMGASTTLQTTITQRELDI